MITQNRLRELFDYTGGSLVRKTVQPKIGRKGCKIGWPHNGYVRGSVGGKFEYLHRMVWIYHYGEITKGMEIDHINHNRTDNRIENLRMVANKENKRNLSLSKRSSTGYSNIRYRDDVKKYQVRFKINQKEQNFGWFTHLHDAIAERDRAKVVLGFHPNHGL